MLLWAVDSSWVVLEFSFFVFPPLWLCWIFFSKVSYQERNALKHRHGHWESDTRWVEMPE